MPYYSRRLWVLLIVLDPLPWPWGEKVLAFLCLVRFMARSSGRRNALAWASAQRRGRRWRLAAAVCAFTGRSIARWRFLGFRSPEELRSLVVVDGEQHLSSVSGGAILLTFHLGPPTSHLLLRLRGHDVRFLGRHDRIAAAEWWSEAWHPIVASSPLSSGAEDLKRWVAVLHSARRSLLDGGKICIMADGGIGRELFRAAVPGGVMVVRAGWLTLHRLTGAPVLPVLTHLEGQRQVITIHPPLPLGEVDAAQRLETWREILTSLVVGYVRRFPDQCPGLAGVW